MGLVCLGQGCCMLQVFLSAVQGHRCLSLGNAKVPLHHEVVAYNYVPIHLGLVELSLGEGFFAEVRAAQFTMVHELQRVQGFLCTSHHVLGIGYL